MPSRLPSVAARCADPAGRRGWLVVRHCCRPGRVIALIFLVVIYPGCLPVYGQPGTGAAGHASAGVPGLPTGVTVNTFDVRIYAIRRRCNRRRPFEVRWHAAGRAWSRSFITRGLADSYRAELIRAARKGLGFSPGTGEPASWAARAGHHQLAGARGRLRCDEVAHGGGAHPGRDRRRAGHHHSGSHHARAGQAASGGAARRPLPAGVQPCGVPELGRRLDQGFYAARSRSLMRPPIR